MDAARAAMGQGWPFAAGLWSDDEANEPRRSRGRMAGRAVLVTFAKTKVSRPAGRKQYVSNSPKSIKASSPDNLAQRWMKKASSTLRCNTRA